MDQDASIADYRDIHLLPRHRLIKTGPVDHADWTYRGLVGVILRTRFRAVKRLMDQQHFGRLLEIGYGSGVFAPELKRHCRQYVGVDIHDKPVEVAEILHQVDIDSQLYQASAAAMPFPDAHFDCVVALSTMEFVDDQEAACREICRVLKPSGRFLLVTPRKSPLLDLGLKVLTGESAKRDYQDGRERLLVALKDHFVDFHGAEQMPGEPHFRTDPTGRRPTSQERASASAMKASVPKRFERHGNFFYSAFRLARAPGTA